MYSITIIYQTIYRTNKVNYNNLLISVRLYFIQISVYYGDCSVYFWQKHKILLYPLFEIAMKYSIIPATSVPSERVFSKAGEILNAKRNRLNAKHLDILIFLNKNLKQF